MDIGVILPTSTPDPSQPILGDVRASARFAEAAGLESVWSTDHLVASAPILDSTVTLATAAAVTDRIRIGYGVLLLALRPTVWAAKQISSLQHVSGNRLLVGIGTGNPAHGDIGWRAAGASYTDRGRATDAALRVLPDLIAGRTAALPDGTEVAISPGATVPPLLVAGDGPRARRRAAEFADAWMAIAATPEQIETSARELRDLAAEFGRPAPSITVVAPPLGTDPDKAADQAARYAEAGVQRLVAAPTGTDWQSGYEFAAALNAAIPARSA